MKIAVLTSGGDGSGTNAYLKNLFDFSSFYKYDLFAVRNGFSGLLANDFYKLTADLVECISNVGGTIIGSSRCKEFYNAENVKKAYNILKKNKIDFLIVLGGDGSFKGAKELIELGQKVICVPVTIDNDLFYTDYSIGYDSALCTVVDSIENIKQTMHALNRGVLVEVMGRDCGILSYNAALATEADMVLTNEYKLSFEEIAKNVNFLFDNGKKFPVIVLKEKMIDIRSLTDYLNEKTKVEFRYSILGYVQRGSKPSTKDKILARQFAYLTIQLIKENIINVAVGIKNNEYFSIDLVDALKQKDKTKLEIKKFFLN